MRMRGKMKKTDRVYCATLNFLRKKGGEKGILY